MAESNKVFAIQYPISNICSPIPFYVFPILENLNISFVKIQFLRFCVKVESDLETFRHLDMRERGTANDGGAGP